MATQAPSVLPAPLRIRVLGELATVLYSLPHTGRVVAKLDGGAMSTPLDGAWEPAYGPMPQSAAERFDAYHA